MSLFNTKKNGKGAADKKAPVSSEPKAPTPQSQT
jgi:hypothetical protein